MENTTELISKLQMLFEVNNNVVEQNEIKRLCERNDYLGSIEEVINSLKYIYKDRLCEVRIGDYIYYILLSKDIVDYELFTFELKKIMGYGLANIHDLINKHKTQNAIQNQEEMELKIKEYIEQEVSDNVIPSLSHILTMMQKNIKKYIDQHLNGQ